MTTRRALRKQLADAIEQRAYWGEKADERKAAIDKMKDRIRAEYERHVPKVDPAQYGLRLGNTATADIFCAAPDCRYTWPCPQWHMLRRIYGYDKSEYQLKFSRRSEDGAR